MRRLPALLFLLLALIPLSIPVICLASEGLEVPEALEQKASLEGLSGISLFFATTYNSNLWLYAVYCTVLMASIGTFIAYLTDFVLKAFGMEVHKIEHKE